MTSETKKPIAFKIPKRAGLLLVLPLSLGLASLATAHPGGEGRRGRAQLDPAQRAQMTKCHEQRRASKISKFDSDGDGKLSEAERKIAKSTRKAERLGAYDKDRDGTLSDAEKADFLHDKAAENFAKIDSNSDAALSLAEAKNSCSPLAFRFDRFDADGNDSISWSEFEKSAKKHSRGGKHRKRGMRSGASRRGRVHSGDGSAQ